MKKSFVAVVTFEDDDTDPVDLSNLATWVEAGLMDASGVRNVDVTTYHRAADASHAAEPSDLLRRIVSARKVVPAIGRSSESQLCVQLEGGPELLLHTYFEPGSTFDEQSLVGLTMDEMYAATELLAPAGVAA